MRPGSVSKPLPLHILYIYILSLSLRRCDSRHPFLTARNADSRPLFDHKSSIGVNANVQDIVQLRTKSRSQPPFHVPLMQCLFLSRRGGESSLFSLLALPYSSEIYSSLSWLATLFLSFSATHMLAKQKNPPSPSSLAQLRSVVLFRK